MMALLVGRNKSISSSTAIEFNAELDPIKMNTEQLRILFFNLRGKALPGAVPH